jgi:hypothetical protein
MNGTFMLSLDTEIAWGTDPDALPLYAHFFLQFLQLHRYTIEDSRCNVKVLSQKATIIRLQDNTGAAKKGELSVRMF